MHHCVNYNIDSFYDLSDFTIDALQFFTIGDYFRFDCIKAVVDFKKQSSAFLFKIYSGFIKAVEFDLPKSDKRSANIEHRYEYERHKEA